MSGPVETLKVHVLVANFLAFRTLKEPLPFGKIFLIDVRVYPVAGQRSVVGGGWQEVRHRDLTLVELSFYETL